MLGCPWFTIVGLALDVAAAYVLTRELRVSEEKAVELGVFRWAGATREENVRLPTVRDRLRQSRNAVWGLRVLTVGFLLQIVGACPD